MQTKTIEQSGLSLEQVDHILKDMGVRPRLSGEVHIKDEDFAAYVMALCTPAEFKAIKRHLDNCPECKEHMDFLYQCEQLWEVGAEKNLAVTPALDTKPNQVKPERRFAQLSKKFHETIATLMPSPIPGFAGAEGAPQNPTFDELYLGEQNDVLLLAAEFTENGCLDLRFSTKTLDRGHRLILSNSKGFYQEVEMKRLGNELFAEMILSEAQSQAFIQEVPTVDWPEETA
jgi:hypothetical protein